MRDDLCSFSSSKLFSLHMHESNSNQSQLKLMIHPAMKHHMGSWYMVRLADSTEQTWTAEACLTPTQKEEDHTRRYTRRQKCWLSRGLHAPRACAHCNSVMSSLQLTFTLCRHYPPADNGAHSPARSPQPAVHHASC